MRLAESAVLVRIQLFSACRRPLHRRLVESEKPTVSPLSTTRAGRTAINVAVGTSSHRSPSRPLPKLTPHRASRNNRWILNLTASDAFSTPSTQTSLISRDTSAMCRYSGISVRLNRFAGGLGCGVYAAETAMPSCSQELATSDTVARCMSRFQRRSSKSEPRCIVQRLSQITRSWTRQRCV
jgi:hypothetical protein